MLKVQVAAVEPAALWIVSSLARSAPFTVPRNVKLVPALMVLMPASSMTAPNIRSPAAVVTAAVDVMLFAVVVPFALFFAVTSTGVTAAIPLYSWINRRRYGGVPLNVAVTVTAPPLMLAA